MNGFLNEENDTLDDWRPGAHGALRGHPWYLATWESKTKASLGLLLGGNAGKAAAGRYFVQLAKRANRKSGSKLNPATMAAIVADILGNDWHTAMVKAAMTGIVLADLMSRTPEKKYILVGHSLGCRVIYYALEALSTRTDTPVVENVILLGGAVGADDEPGWTRALQAVTGKIYNCYSKNDRVLNAAYRCANAFLSEPIGFGPVALQSPRIENWDCSGFIDGHMTWKPELAHVLEYIRYAR